MRNFFLAVLVLLALAPPVRAADEVWHTQIQMLVPETDPNHVVRKATLDAAVANAVVTDAEGNIVYPAGLALRARLADGTLHDILATDTDGNAVLGDGTQQFNINVSAIPTVTVGGVTDTVVMNGALSNYYLKSDTDGLLAYKADLVGGVVPDAQLPSSVKVVNHSVPTKADLVTLTTATVNDRAFVGDNDPATPPAEGDGTYYLLSLPPTTLANWFAAADAAGQAETDPVYSADRPSIDAAIEDRALASSLANYVLLSGGNLANHTATTPAAAALGTEVVTAAWVRGILTSNLSLVNPLMDGTASPGSVTTVARADHIHPSDSTKAVTTTAINTTAPLQGGGNLSASRTLTIAAATAATATAAGSAGSAVYAPDNAAATVRNQAMTPAGFQAAWNTHVLWGTGDPPSGTFPAGTIYLKIE